MKSKTLSGIESARFEKWCKRMLFMAFLHFDDEQLELVKELMKKAWLARARKDISK